MSRRDYVAIAAAFRREFLLWSGDPDALDARLAVKSLAGRVADVLAADNPNFNRERFLTAALQIEENA